MNSYINTASGITLFFASDSSQHTVKNTHPKFLEICKMATEGRFDEILDLIDVKSAMDKFIYVSMNERFSITNGVLSFDGQSVHSSLTNRMVEMAFRGLDISAMENFMINLMENPSYRAVTELYDFLELGKLPITEDGHFLAYKRISADFTDVYTGEIDNSIGAVVEMPRNKVNEDKNQTCSSGLHFCSYDYLSHYNGERVVVLKINPRDVVSIPSDYNNTKGRCCRYEVLRELEDFTESNERIEGVMSYYDRSEFDSEEYDINGYDENGYDEDGYDEDGYDEDGYDINGYNEDGYNEDGFDEDGFYEDGFDENGFDRAGYDRNGNLKDGFGETTGFNKPVKATNLRTGESDVFVSIDAAEFATGVPREYIRRVLVGTKNSYMGYKFSQ